MDIANMDLFTLIHSVQDYKLQIQKSNSAKLKTHIMDDDKLTYAQIPVNLRADINRAVKKPAMYTPNFSPHKYPVTDASIGRDFNGREDSKPIVNKYAISLLNIMDALEFEMLHGDTAESSYGIVPLEYDQWMVTLDKMELLVTEHIELVGSIRTQEKPSKGK